MRVLLFIPALNAGGAERVMVTLANYLAKQNNEIEILTLNSDYSFYSVNGGVTVKGMNLSISSSGIKRKLDIVVKEILRRKAFIEEVNNFDADVVLSFLNTTNFIALSAIKHIKCPLIISERNDPSSYSRFAKLACKMLYPKASTVVCQGKKVSDYYSKFGAKCRVIPNPLNPAAVGKMSESYIKKIVAVGRLIEAKNHALLINAFAKIASKYPDYSVEIYGEGELEGQLNNQIEELGLSNRVKLCGTRKNIMTLVSDYCCFVLPSNYEGFPNVLLEAMASGLPVISTDFSTGIARDLISEDVNGYVISINDADALAEAIEKLILDADKNLKMRKKNVEINEVFSEDRICKKWMALLSERIEVNNVR